MKRLFRITVLAMLLGRGISAPAPAQEPAGASPGDARRIQGSWSRTGAVLGDTPFTPDILVPVEFTLKDGGYEKIFNGGKPEKGTYAIDSAANPKALTLTCTEGENAGKEFLCIYEFDGDTLRTCMVLPGTKERPVTFKGSSDPGHLFTETFKPAQNKEKPEAAKAEAPSKTNAAAALEESRRLQGSWSRTGAVLGDIPLPAESLKSLSLVLKDGKYEKTTDGGKPEKGTYAMDTSTNPVSLTFTCTEGENAGKEILAICQLDGDTLRICVDMPGTKRPAAFTSTSGTQHLFIETYKRAPQ